MLWMLAMVNKQTSFTFKYRALGAQVFISLILSASSVLIEAQTLGSPAPLAQSSQQSVRLLQISATEVFAYSSPSKESKKLAQIERGTLVTLVATNGNWSQIELNETGKLGWVLQEKGSDGVFTLQELAGPGVAFLTNPILGDIESKELFPPLIREQSVPTLISAPPIDPSQTSLPEASFPRESISIPDRWRLMQSLGFKHPIYDPYNQNVIKGDLPVFKNLAPDLFFNLGIISDNLLEFRTLPTPVSQTTSFGPGANGIFGSKNQSIQASTLIMNFGLTKGNTTFRPPDLEFRFVPAFQFNHVEVGEAGALYVDPTYGKKRNASYVGVQELFLDYHLRNVSTKFDFDSVRVGIQPFTSDFRGFLFQDTSFGVRLFGNRNSNLYQYNLAAFQRIEKDTNTGLNNIGKPLRQDYVFAANLYRQDFPVPGFTSQLTAIHNINRETSPQYDENGFLVRPAFLGDVRPRDYNVTYLGYSGDGSLGYLSEFLKLNLSTSTYFASGNDTRSPISGQSESIQAYFHASELSRDFNWVRLRGNFLIASGDKDPYDGQENGFDAIYENPQFAGSDTSYWIRQSIPLIGGGGVGLSGRNGLLPSLRSSKDQGQSNFINPGLRLIGIGTDLDVLPQLRIFGNISQLSFMNVSSLAILRNQMITSTDIGVDYSIGFHWRPYYNQNLVINGSVALLKTGEAMKQLYGQNVGTLRSVLFNAILNF